MASTRTRWCVISSTDRCRSPVRTKYGLNFCRSGRDRASGNEPSVNFGVSRVQSLDRDAAISLGLKSAVTRKSFAAGSNLEMDLVQA